MEANPRRCARLFADGKNFAQPRLDQFVGMLWLDTRDPQIALPFLDEGDQSGDLFGTKITSPKTLENDQGDVLEIFFFESMCGFQPGHDEWLKPESGIRTNHER